ncbi:hypothetical protein [uncultured Ralstonia sp.]|jgi:hypothetical protein|nr:hypothetical protein [uncultured Ralstonia sp.]UCF24386.1 MAG: hypothetical protein JSV72_02565 [Ralstonia sp.]
MPKLSDGTQVMRLSGTAGALQYEIAGVALTMAATTRTPRIPSINFQAK